MIEAKHLLGTSHQLEVAIKHLEKIDDEKLELIEKYVSKHYELYNKNDGTKRKRLTYKSIFELSDKTHQEVKHLIVNLDRAIQRKQ